MIKIKDICKEDLVMIINSVKCIEFNLAMYLLRCIECETDIEWTNAWDYEQAMTERLESKYTLDILIDNYFEYLKRIDCDTMGNREDTKEIQYLLSIDDIIYQAVRCSVVDYARMG